MVELGDEGLAQIGGERAIGRSQGQGACLHAVDVAARVRILGDVADGDLGEAGFAQRERVADVHGVARRVHDEAAAGEGAAGSQGDQQLSHGLEPNKDQVRKSDPSPSSVAKPMQSVNVVRITPADRAGSMRMRRSSSGTITPTAAAAMRLISVAAAMMAEIFQVPNQTM